MEEAVLKALGGKNPEELQDLRIQSINSANIEGISDKFTQLKELELLNCGITSLSNLPRLPSLKTLVLGDNKLKGKEEVEHVVKSCPAVETLSFVGNKFESIDDMKPLETLQSLTCLDLFDCPLTQQTGYRDKLWNLLPNLTVLDGYDCNGKEVPDNEEEVEGEEGEDESGEDDEVGLEYLQRELSSGDEEDEDEYNPEVGASPPSDDHEIIDDDDDDGGDDDVPSSTKTDEKNVEDIGPSQKKIKLDQPLEQD